MFVFLFSDILLPEGDVEKFYNSRVVANAEELLKRQDQPPAIDEFNLMRNYIIVRLLLENAQRTGAALNLTLRDVANIQQSPDGHGSVIQIPRHKTDTGGAAPVTLLPPLDEFFAAYLKIVKEMQGFANRLDDKIFVTFSADNSGPRPLVHSIFNKCLKSLWKRAGCESQISATIIRKTVVSRVRDANPQEKEALAGHMCHSVATQEIHYKRSDKVRLAPRMSRLIKKSLRPVSIIRNYGTLCYLFSFLLSYFLSISIYSDQQ